MVMGVPQPVVGQPFTVDVQVEANADASPAATGNVTLHWGDGSQAATVPLSNSLVTAAHAYAATGLYTITANYAGDSNYSAAATTRTVLALATPPAVPTLNTFGDSITWGRGASTPATDFANVTATTEGWTLNNLGIRSDLAVDTCEEINAVSPLPANAYNTLLIGQNDIPSASASAAGTAEYVSAVTSCAVWLATTQGVNRIIAASPANTLTGIWTPSTLYVNTGLNTLVAGSTVTGSVTGNVIYAQLTTQYFSSYSVSISVDEAPAVTYTPAALDYNGNRVAFGPYSIRIPVAGANTVQHKITFTCVDPGTTGCYVDWFAGNAPALATAPPYLWIGTPYDTLQTTNTPAEYTQMDSEVRSIQQQLQSDGFPVYLADVANWFVGATNPQCMYDTIHPNDCGHAILAATYIKAMNKLLSSVTQASLTVEPNPVSAGQTATVTASILSTSGSPSGTATFLYDGATFGSAPVTDGVATLTTSTAPLLPGNYPITVAYSGDASFAGTTSPVYSAVVTAAPTTTSLSVSPTSITPPATAVLTAKVARSAGSGTPTGTVTFYYQSLALGTASVGASGTATLSVTSNGVPAGTYGIVATYSGDAQDSRSSSAASTVTVQ
jgi:hypothetical protein